MEKLHVNDLNEAKNVINLAMITGQMLIKTVRKSTAPRIP